MVTFWGVVQCHPSLQTIVDCGILKWAAEPRDMSQFRRKKTIGMRENKKKKEPTNTWDAPFVCKMCAKIHQKKQPKGWNFTYLEDPGTVWFLQFLHLTESRCSTVLVWWKSRHQKPVKLEKWDVSLLDVCANIDWLGGGFKYFVCSPLFGEDFQFD